MFKFLHAADIHLDSPLKGLEQYEGAPVEEIRNAARRAMENLVELAIDEQVEFVLIAGDLYDGDWKGFNTGLFFVKQAVRLREAGIPLYLISGNHDAASKITRELHLPENVTFFSSKKPETALLPKLEVALHGQSYAKPAIEKDLSQDYPDAKPGYLNIGLLHTCATGREGHASYAPCTLEGLRVKGYDYWALGHIHKREMLSDEPLIAFSGNIQGRHVRETGPKGCLLVTVADDRTMQADFRALDVLRWEVARVDLSDAMGADDAMILAAKEIARLHGKAEGRTLALRIELHGKSAAHRPLHADKQRWTNELRARANDVGLGEVWVEKVKFRTSEPVTANNSSTATRSLENSDSVLDDGTLDDSALGELRAVFAQAQPEPTGQAGSDLPFNLEDVLKKLPAELKEAIRPDDPDWLREVMAEAESLLMSRLFGSEWSGAGLNGATDLKGATESGHASNARTSNDRVEVVE